MPARPARVAALLPRDLHPLAWWVWALGLATAATLTTNPLLLVLLVAVACFVVALRRGDHPWAKAFRLYLLLGLVIVVVRVLFRVLLGGSDGGTVWLALPEVPLPDWAAGIRLLGPVTQEAVLAGLYDGLRLAALVIAIGAANALANPKRLLRSLPPALYEIGSALVVAVTVLPQIADSVRRVRAALRLRGEPPGRFARIRGLPRLVVPVLEDALERSMRLAAGMDARGYGRTGPAAPAQRRTTGVLMVSGLLGICVGVYAVLDRTAPRVLAAPMLVLGCLLALAGFVAAGRRVHRSRYRPDRWRGPELLVAGCGVVSAVLVARAARVDPLLVAPGVDTAPVVSATLLAAVLVAAVPAVASPPAPSGARPPAPPERAAGPDRDAARDSDRDTDRDTDRASRLRPTDRRGVRA